MFFNDKKVKRADFKMNETHGSICILLKQLPQVPTSEGSLVSV